MLKIFKYSQGNGLLMRMLACVFFVAFVCVALAPQSARAMDRTYRIGYIEGGPFWAFTDIIDAMKKSLNKTEGWTDQVVLPEDAYFSAGWDEEGKKLPDMAKQLMGRLDLDVIIAAGSEATEAILSVNNYMTPVVGIAISDPVKLGFVSSESDSGINNFTTQVDPDGIKQMFNIFHDAVGFKRVGFMMWKTKDNWLEFHLEDAEEVAKERGFSIVTSNFSENQSSEQCYEDVKKMLDQDIDAFFIPPHPCFEWTTNHVPELYKLLWDRKIPTFTPYGKRDVQAGALLGFVETEISKIGAFVASKLVRIFEGQLPRTLPMMDDANPKIYLNLQVARDIDFEPSFSILASTDELYETIEFPKDRLKPGEKAFSKDAKSTKKEGASKEEK